MKVLPLIPIVAVIGALSTNHLAAQTFTTLHSFSATIGGTNSDGANAWAGLQASGNTLFGAAAAGTFGAGTIFKMNKDGTAFATLHNFATGAVVPYAGSGYWVNSDGLGPGGLEISSNVIYGSCGMGGVPGCGTLFKLNTDGTSFTLLHTFSALKNGIDGAFGTHTGGTNSDGSQPGGRKVLLGNRLFGTARYGGSGQSGTIFSINTDGTGFTNIYSFSALDPATGVNSDGAVPNDLILISNRLYGTALYGGISGAGAVFGINTDGSGFANLHSFAYFDGTQPLSLISSGNTLYGTTYWGGNSWPNSTAGTVFSLNTDGTSFQSLYSFTDDSQQTNSDGCCPQGELVPVGNVLYGTASHAGPNGLGTIFALNTDGTGFTNLYSFSADSGSPDYTNSDGATPAGLLVISSNTLYGTTVEGGPSGTGTIFGLSLTAATVPQLGINLSGPSIILAWPVGATGYLLQSATTLLNGGDWKDSTATPNQTNGQNVVTVNASSTAGFFRLRLP